MCDKDKAVLFLRAQTSLHPGTGASVGAIDLPVQRERHTGWPAIQGTSLKGVLRDLYRWKLVRDGACETPEEADKHWEVVETFGPPAGRRDEHYAGALTVSDARILAFPVRSGKGIFAWVTCPAVLRRLAGDLAVVGAQGPGTPQAADGEAVGCTGAADLIGIRINENDTRVLLEDIAPRLISENGNNADDVAEWVLGGARVAGQPPGEDDLKRLVILGDNDFSYLVRHTTEIVQRIKLDPKTKTVEGRALFTQELLPAEIIMYSLLLAEAPRRPQGEQENERQSKQPAFKNAGEVMDKLKARCAGGLLQIGGDETTGKGWSWASVLYPGELRSGEHGR